MPATRMWPSGCSGAGSPFSRASSCSSVSVFSCSGFRFSGFFFAVMALRSLVAEVQILQRQLDFHFAHMLDRRLQIVALLAADAQLVALDGDLHLQLRILERPHDV